MTLGTLGSIVHGFAQPVGYMLLGKALDAFGNNINDTAAMVNALKKVIPFVWYMAFATFPPGILGNFLTVTDISTSKAQNSSLSSSHTCTNTTDNSRLLNKKNIKEQGKEIGCWMYASQRQVARLGLEFLSAVLKQEIGAFDTDLTSGKIIIGISSHLSLIQDTIGEKTIHTAFLLLRDRQSLKSKPFLLLLERLSIKSFLDCIERQTNLSKKEAFIKGLGTGMFQTVTFSSWALIVWVGAVVVSARRSSGGDVIAAVMSILFGAISLTYATPDMQIFNQAKAAGKEIFQMIERKPTINADSRGKTLDVINGNFSVKDIHFAYPSRPEKMVLQGFSLSIPAGKVVALVGSSGCGNPSGDILLDNHNIKDLDLKFLRRNIGLVSQEPPLFAGSIKDDIKIGKRDADDQEIERASALANAHSFIQQLPDQYLTEVGQRGLQLSGGQKQRIAIARAILKNPPILLLDEATSALDTESEKQVQEALDTAMQGRTVILIAHRMSTIIGADIIAVVRNGIVTETGTHQNLLDTTEFYSALVNMQNISQDCQTRSDATQRHTSHYKIQIKITTDEKTELIQQDDAPQDHQQPHEELKQPHEKKQKRKKETHVFFKIWFGLNKSELIKTAIGSFAAAFAGISKPVFGFYIITIGVAYYNPDSKDKVARYSAFFTSIGLLSLFAHTLQHYLFGVAGEKAMTNLRRALYTAILRNELAWFEKPENSIGSLTSRIVNETSTVKTIIADRMSVIVQCVSSIVIATTVSMIVNWRMGLVAWAVMPCHFIGGLVQAKSAKGFSSDSSVAHSELVSLASESAMNIKTVAAFCHEIQILEKAKLCLKRPLRKGRTESIKYGIIQGISFCLWNIAHAVALWYTTVLVDKNQASFEDGISSYQIFSLTVPSITELWTLIPTVLSAIGVLKPVFQSLDRCTEIVPDMPDNASSESIKGEIQFQNVQFHYTSRPEVMVLNNFSLQIEAGLKMAIVGPSGAGKSSILALLLRFYDVIEGKVLIDSIKPIRYYNLRKLRAQIGLVQQEPLLFSCTIRDNIRYGSEKASEAEIMEVSREANIHEFISNLANGYDTVLGEKGSQLSGGQKQRIAIARALLKKPAIMLLDEATSALDAESERAVVSALESMKLNNYGGTKVTQITVAHKLSTVINSDTTVVMDKGKLVEKGSHSTLMAEPDSVYSSLVRLQSVE
ncbi:ABC transporter B family member 13-like [Lycium ferocissimum]|uniref:ABC transporter B family member 13-like n=1 Tax=Lycium ferocissimum TaxID=112874 RepID=UPI002816920B|nr:ABC transporter B family member 13-like [Lycium ferocissimum]